MLITWKWQFPKLLKVAASPFSIKFSHRYRCYRTAHSEFMTRKVHDRKNAALSSSICIVAAGISRAQRWVRRQGRSKVNLQTAVLRACQADEIRIGRFFREKTRCRHEGGRLGLWLWGRRGECKAGNILWDKLHTHHGRSWFRGQKVRGFQTLASHPHRKAVLMFKAAA